MVAATMTAAVTAGCGGAPPSPTGTIAVSDAWVRAPTGLGTLTAAYFEITNSGAQPDTLLRVSVPAATSAMLHQSSTGPDGVTSMLPVPTLVVPAGATVTLAPGGYHLMVDGAPASLVAGDHLEIDLEFEHAGTVMVEAEVRAG